jgi:hypothetical protein
MRPSPSRFTSFALILVLAAVSPARAAGTFYVDNSGSSCSDVGPGTEAQPYCTISAAVAAHHGAGTTIIVKSGVYPEQVTIPASGSAGSPFVIQGVGGPVVDGCDDFSAAPNWVQINANVFLAAGVTWSPSQVFLDGARLVAAAVAPTDLPDQTFTWVSGVGLYVNTGAGSPATHQTLVGHRPYGFLAAARSWVTIDGFTVTRAEDRCIQFNNACTNIVVSHNTVSFAHRYGMQAVGGSAFLIDSNVAHDNDDHGIMCLNGVTASTIQNNESFRNFRPAERAANGINLFNCPGNVIRSNRTHDNQDSGLQVESGSNDCLLTQNMSWHNGDHGFDNINATGTVHLGDVAYGNHMDGFSIEGTATGTVVYNCIAVDNGLGTNEFDLWVNPASSVGFVSDYNIFWNSTSQEPVKYIATQYNTIAAYSAVSGQDTHSIQADPALVNPWLGNFGPLGGSPAIDAANSGVANWPATDAAGNARFDDPSTLDTGVGPVSYADLGAMEYLGSPGPLRPIASLVMSPPVGTDPVLVLADATASSAPGSQIASYTFDFGDGTSQGPQATPLAPHLYTVGNWLASVVVTDANGVARAAYAPVIVAPGAAGGNLVSNPSFETNLDGWNAFDGATLTRVAGGCDGDYSLQVTATGPTAATFGVNDHPDWVRNVVAAGVHYRFSACVRSDSDTGRAAITLREYAQSTGQLLGSVIGGIAVLSPVWQTITMDYVTVSPGTSLDFQVRDIPRVPGEVFQVDNISITLIAPPTSVGNPTGLLALAPRVYPSPLRTSATLSFATSQPGRLRVDMFDLGGRRVRRLLDETAAPAGMHALSISRQGGADGRALGAGMYFYRIEAGEGMRTGRFVVIN